MQHRATVFVVLVALVLVGTAACSDSASQSTRFQVADLHGPPGSAYNYRGRVGDDLYFVGQLRDWVPGWPMPAHIYSPGRGWSRGSFPEQGWKPLAETPRVVEADGEGFVLLNPGLDAPAHLYRLTDGGRSHEDLGEVPEGAMNLQSDGQALYLHQEGYEGPDNTTYVRRLMRSTDAGQSWTSVRDDMEGRRYLAVNGWLAVPVRTSGENPDVALRVSDDQGENWSDAPPNWGPLPETPGRSDTLPRWVSVGGAAVTAIRDQEGVKLGVWTALDTFAWVDVPSATASPVYLTSAGERLYVYTDHGTVVEVGGTPEEWTSGTAPTWQPLATPEDATLGVPSREDGIEPARQSVFALPSGVAALTDAGLWTTQSPDEPSWSFAGHDASSADFVVRDDGGLLAGEPGRIFQRTDGQGSDGWRRLDFGGVLANSVLLRHGGRLLAVSVQDLQPPTLYTVDLQEQTATQIWQDPEVAGHQYAGFRALPSAHLLDVDGQLYVGSAGNFREVIAADGNTLLDQSGGGIFRLDLDTGQAEQILDAFPGSGLPSVQSMVHFDGDLWIVSAVQGVWRIDPTDASATRVHQGLPEETYSDVKKLVQGLVVLDGTLYAYSSQAIYALDAERWTALPHSDFDQEAAISGIDPTGETKNTNGIIDLLPDGDKLMAVTLDGLYTIDPATGDFEHLDADFGAPIYKVFPADDGMYVSLWQGGLRRLQE